MTIVEQQLEDQHFLEDYDKFQNEVTHRNYDKTANFAELSDIPRQFDNFLDQFYQIKGKYFIITHINTLIGDFQLLSSSLTISLDNPCYIFKNKTQLRFHVNIILHEIVMAQSMLLVILCYILIYRFGNLFNSFNALLSNWINWKIMYHLRIIIKLNVLMMLQHHLFE